jgi:hypothetical protein
MNIPNAYFLNLQRTIEIQGTWINKKELIPTFFLNTTNSRV